MINIEKLMLPLWLEYPSYSRYCLGWRMGGGESYNDDFYQWFGKLNDDEKNEYIDMYPEPVEWHGWYDDEASFDYFEDGILAWDKIKPLRYDHSYVHTVQHNKKTKCLYFWGHQPSRDGSITKSCFSQWWQSEFYVSADKYCCMEQYMMAEKARLFEDEEILDKIMSSQEPGKIKALGRKVRGFEEDKWNQHKYRIVLMGNYYKFATNQELRDFLLATGNKILVEASPYDRVWGVGLSADDEKIGNPAKWKGLNLLGYALMEVRDEIRKVYNNYHLVS